MSGFLRINSQIQYFCRPECFSFFRTRTVGTLYQPPAVQQLTKQLVEKNFNEIWRKTTSQRKGAPKIATCHSVSQPPPKIWFQAPTRVHNPNSISIGSAVLAQIMVPIQQTRSQLWQQNTYTLFPGLPGWAGTRKVKQIWILLQQETVSGSGISWAIYASVHLAPHR